MTNETSFLNSAANLGNLLQINYKGKVQPWLGKMSPITAAYQALGPGQYSLQGKQLTIAADNLYAGGAMSTGGSLPGSMYVDPVQLTFNAKRTYVRRMVDNFIEALAGGEATFEPFMGRIMEQMWDAFERTEIRHAHGSSAAKLCEVVSRTSATEIVVKNGYGYTGAAPGMFIEEGMWLAWWDTTGGAFDGIGTVSGIVHDSPLPNQATITFVATIEGTDTIAAGDFLYFCTSTSQTDDWSDYEKDMAPMGLLDHIDPLSAVATYGGLTEATTKRLSPQIVTSADWGEVEFKKFIGRLRAKSQAAVNAQTHLMACNEHVTFELAKTLLPFTQIMTKGETLPGGWETVTLNAGGGPFRFVEDPYCPPAILYALCLENMFKIDLDGDKRLYDEDGSVYQRLLNFDGKQFWARHYGNYIMNQRNRSGALIGIDSTEYDEFTPVPV